MTRGDRVSHAADLLDFPHFREDSRLHLLGEGLDKIGTRQWIHCVPQADFVHDDFKGPQGQQGGARRRNGIGFVEGAQRRGLGAAQGRCQGVKRPAHDVVLRLRLGQPAAAPAEKPAQEEVFRVRHGIVLFEQSGP